MPTVRRIEDTVEISAEAVSRTYPINNKPRSPLSLVKRGASAIETIVATARPGEVIYVSDAAYYNPHLWRSYSDL